MACVYACVRMLLATISACDWISEGGTETYQVSKYPCVDVCTQQHAICLLTHHPIYAGVRPNGIYQMIPLDGSSTFRFRVKLIVTLPIFSSHVCKLTGVFVLLSILINVSVCQPVCLLYNSHTMKPSSPNLCMFTKGTPRECMNENWVFGLI